MHFRQQFGMERFVFCKLLQALKHRTEMQDTKYVSAEEQLDIFLQIAHTGMSNARCKNASSAVGKQFPSKLNFFSSFIYQD